MSFYFLLWILNSALMFSSLREYLYMATRFVQVRTLGYGYGDDIGSSQHEAVLTHHHLSTSNGNVKQIPQKSDGVIR